MNKNIKLGRTTQSMIHERTGIYFLMTEINRQEQNTADKGPGTLLASWGGSLYVRLSPSNIPHPFEGRFEGGQRRCTCKLR